MVRMWIMRLETNGIPLHYLKFLIPHAQGQFTDVHGNKLHSLRGMGFSTQITARFDFNPIDFEAQPLFNGKQGIQAIFPIIFDQRLDSGLLNDRYIGLRKLISVVNETFNPFAIFQTVATVGLESPRSIWPSILLLTPVNSATRSRLNFLSSRRRFRF